MRLIFDCERMKYPNTGIYEYCYQLGLALAKISIKDLDVWYYLPDNVKNRFDTNSVIKLSKLHKLFPISAQADVWHITYQSTSYMPRGKMPKVLTIHDLNFLYENHDLSKKKKLLKMVQNNVDRCDHIVTISNFVKQNIEQHVNIRGKKIDVVYNGCNVLEFPDFSSPTYKPVKPFLFSLGTVVPKKNFHVLPSLLKNSDYELIIAGVKDRNYSEKIIELARSFGVSNQVKLLGAVSVEDKYWYLKNCSAFLFPSIAEGFGIPVIEAMHFGKPVFLSTCTSLPEIGGKWAYYFDSFDPESMTEVFKREMENYSKDVKRQTSIIKHANSFNWNQSANEYLEVYKKLYNAK